jgi:CheY-like chemotaxis protein
VEDNPANLALVRKVLETASNIEVQGAESAELALPILEAAVPQLVLMDLDLPGMSGLELTRRLKEDPRWAAIPVIAISASVMKHERSQALAVGCVAFVEKPFDIQSLRELVRATLAGQVPGPG